MKKIFSIILASFCMVSCVDTVILPDNVKVDEDMWKTKSDVSGIVACAYNQLRNENLMRNLIVWGDFRSDELVLSSATGLTNSSAYKIDLNQIYSLNILPSNAFTNWDALYSAINYCNLVIEKAEGVVALDPNYTKGDYLADISRVKALRALCYFYLVRVFRDVPVSTVAYTSSEQETKQEQKAPAEVLAMCIEDLKSAEPNAISSSTYGDWRDRGYMTRDAIYALLADIYLWRASVNHDVADYQACVEYCDKVIKSKKNAHVLMMGEEEKEFYLAKRNDYYDKLFAVRGSAGVIGQNAEESIFEIQFNSVYVSSTTTQYYSNNMGMFQMYYKFKDNNSQTPYLKTTSDYAQVSASAASSALFKNSEDIRRTEFVYDPDGASEQYLVRKFVASSSFAGGNTAKSGNRTTNNDDFAQNWIVYRLTDVMLMKAEALAQIYQMSDKSEEYEAMNKEAFDLCIVVNDRALLENSSNSFKNRYNTWKENMEQFVMQERARELCFEGKRWFDLMRYNYRHVDGVQYDKTFAEQEGGYAQNYEDMLKLSLGKKYSGTAMISKMPTEPYLYWPINSAQIDVNEKLVQNPVWKATSSTSR